MHSNSHTKLLFTLGLVLLLQGDAAGAQERVRVALLPMVVHSAESPNYVRRGLADMMASRLERVTDLDVIRVEDAAAATTNLAKALKRARKVDAEFVVFGSFTRFGTGASLDVQCAAATREAGDDPLREIFVHSGTIGDVIPDLGDLVGKVARFIIRDYSERIIEAGQRPDLPSTRTLAELKRRVEALEQALSALAGSPAEPEPEPASPVAGGTE